MRLFRSGPPIVALRLRRAPNPILEESAPFHGADS